MSSAAERAQVTGPLAPEDARALTRLLQRSLGHGFRLVVIEVATPRLRKRIVEWLGAELEPLGGELIDLDVRSLPGENLWSELDERLDHGTVDRQRVILTLHGFQEAARGQPDEKAGLYRQLNVQRDLFVRDLGCFWVVLIDPYGSRKLQDIAPDFCDFASLWIRAPKDVVVRGDTRPQMAQLAGGSLVTDVEQPPSDLLARASAAIEAGRYVEARDLLTRFELGADPDNEHQGLALLLRTQLELVRGDLDAAQRAAEQAQAWDLARGDQADPMTAGALALLGVIFENRGDYEQARSSFERACELMQRHYGPEHPNVAGLTLSLGRIHMALGNTDEARRLVERARRLNREPSAATLRGLAWLSADEGNLDAAVRALEEALEIEIQRLSTQLHPNVAVLLFELASVLRKRGDLDAARRNVERALEIGANVFEPELHPNVAASLRELGMILRGQGEFESARQTLERSLAIAEQLFGARPHPSVAATLFELATVLANQGDFDGARQLLARAYEMTVEVFGTELHPSAATTLFALAVTLTGLGELDEAAATFERTLNIEAQLYGVDHPSTASTEVALAPFLLDKGERARAEALLEHARPILADALGPTHASVEEADRLLKACSRTPPA